MKKLLFFILAFCLIFFSTACTPRASIIFNQRPITKENVMDYSSIFQKGTRIYYLIIMPEVQHSRYLNVQIIKKDNSVGYLGY